MSASASVLTRVDPAIPVMPAPRPRFASAVGTRPEALLTVADACGTLAAARAFGRLGVGVVLADHRRLAPTRWSRYVKQTLSCPEVGAEPDRFLAWLLRFGARQPGKVLCGTSDDMVWLVARHRELLSRDFRLYVPPIEAIHSLLDKWRLQSACAALGIDTPDTWLPSTAAHLRHLARTAAFPLVIKPRTQALMAPHQKGRIVDDAAALTRLHRDLGARTRHAQMLVDYDPGAALPIVQAFSRAGADRIYSLAGFTDESGELFIVEASRKVFQWPQHLGIGLCFEEAEVIPALARNVARLCRHVGYYGAFEVEFVESGERLQLIDFNPRFYGQMGFEVSRGLDLPLYAYLAAIGESQALREAIDAARREVVVPPRQPRAYCNRVELEVVLQIFGTTGRISQKERSEQRVWLQRYPDAVDAVVAEGDWAPAAIASVAAVGRALRQRLRRSK